MDRAWSGEGRLKKNFYSEKTVLVRLSRGEKSMLVRKARARKLAMSRYLAMLLRQA